jgi:hypothetical protein
MVGLFGLSFNFTGSSVSSLISLILFVNLGGLGWVRLVDPQHGYGDWVHNRGRGQFEYWFHPLMHVLVPQRASHWSMPLCYWTLILLISAVENREWRLFILAGILTGFTPLVQIHSFVALAQWSISFCLLKFPFAFIKTKSWSQIAKYVGRWDTFWIGCKSDGSSTILSIFESTWNSAFAVSANKSNLENSGKAKFAMASNCALVVRTWHFFVRCHSLELRD